MISTDLFLGKYEFGSENFYAAEKTVFEVSRYKMSLSTSNSTNGTGTSSLPPLQIPSPRPKNAAGRIGDVQGLVRWSGMSVVVALLLQITLAVPL